MREGLEKLLAKGQDSAVLRFGLGRPASKKRITPPPHCIWPKPLHRTRSTPPPGNCWARPSWKPAPPMPMPVR